MKNANSLLLVLFFSLSFVAHSQVENNRSLSLDSAVNNVLTQVLLFPQEKIYVQTDKPYYISGETIFFRIFLLDALSHQPSDISRYVYVELINPLDSLILRHQIRPENNMHYGTVTLDEELPEGNYRIRAYTRFMENMPEEYFYTQSVYIADPQIAKLNRETNFEFINDREIGVSLRFVDAKTKQALLPPRISLRLNQENATRPQTDEDGWVRVRFKLPNRSTQRVLTVNLDFENYSFKQFLFLPFPDDRFDVSFYPEGGNLIAGQTAKIAFKALNSDGNPLDVRGEIFNSKNEKITDFSTFHEGMGQFTFTPIADETYYAVVEAQGEGHKAKKISLPKVQTETYGLAGVWRQNNLLISVKKPETMPEEKLYLAIHTGGMLTYATEWDFTKELMILDKAEFPSGVSHILLLTEDFQLISERLVFVLNEDWISPEISTNKTTYRTREQVKMNIYHDALDVPSLDNIFTTMAISVTDDQDIKIDTTQNILTAILLTSELKGNIVNPAYYFQTGNKRAEFAADLLMLTHGWTRYDIPKAMRGNFQFLTVQNEESQSFSGLVKGGLLHKPYSNSQVTMISTNTGFFDTIKTDENGRFEFTGFEFPDSTNYIIQALTKRGGETVELFVDEITFPSLSPSKPFSARQKGQELFELEDFSNYVVKANEKYTFENGMRMIHLSEVTVRGKRHRSFYNLAPDEALTERDIKLSGDMRNLLSKVPSLRFTSDTVRFRAHGKSGSNSNPPMIMIDGRIVASGDNLPDDTTMDWLVLDILNSIQMDNIAQVNIVHSPAKLYMYGQQGKNGVIEIFTKNGWNYAKARFNVKSITPLGYQTPVEFYSPQYDTPDARNNSAPDLRSTIFWKPNVVSDENGKASLSFFTADSQSSYSAVVEGVTFDGKLIYQRADSLIKVE
jgi:hypothetical protein